MTVITTRNARITLMPQALLNVLAKRVALIELPVLRVYVADWLATIATEHNGRFNSTLWYKVCDVTHPSHR